jgi:hypothetical protein
MARGAFWKITGRFADITQLLFAQPIIIGVSWFVAAMGQTVPFVSTLGLFGISLIGLGCYLVLSLCAWLQSKVKKRRQTDEDSSSRLYQIIKWKGWAWIIFAGFVAGGAAQIETRPRLPLGVAKTHVKHPIASYREMKQGTITGRSVVLSMVPRNPDKPMRIVNKVFDQCQIIGPAVVTRLGRMEMMQCSFIGETGLEDILLETKSSMVTGMIVLQDCKFSQCSFMGISIAGYSNELAEIRKNTGVGPGPRR